MLTSGASGERGDGCRKINRPRAFIFLSWKNKTLHSCNRGYGVDVMKTPRFKTVSEYLAAGGMALKLYLIEDFLYETEKAIAVKATQINRAGNPYSGKAFLPKSQVQMVKNDYYTNGPDLMILVPDWLVRRANLI